MRIAIVVAATEEGVIGKGNSLPWRLPDDLMWFKQSTMGKPIVMGRKTFESIGKALPGRLNIVVTRNPKTIAEGCVTVASIDEALRAAGNVEEVCVIGGGNLYAQTIERTNKIYLTRVHARIPGDVFFPSLAESEWATTFREEHAADERHAYAFTFMILERK